MQHEDSGGSAEAQDDDDAWDRGVGLIGGRGDPANGGDTERHRSHPGAPHGGATDDDADQHHDDRRPDGERALVGRSEEGDRRIDDESGRPIDDDAAHRRDRRRNPLEQAGGELGEPESKTGGGGTGEAGACAQATPQGHS